MTDEYFLKLAIETGNKKAAPYNFGAVVVKDGITIAAGYNHVAETNDPTEHAETSAIKSACQKLETYNLENCTMYASHEPCSMCISCAAWVGINRIVYVTPASKQNLHYQLQGITINELAEALPRPITIERVEL